MKNKRTAIIDYGLCNLLSISNALKYLGMDFKVTDDPKEVGSADAVILPGVGAFEDGMNGLKKKGLMDPIYEFVKTGKPLLGICLGMQMLMTKSYEFGEFEGLGLIGGEVVPFKNKFENGKYNFRVPHIGWNELHNSGPSWGGTILSGLESGEAMYFVHSFYAVPTKKGNVLAKTGYAGIEFCSVNCKDNVYGCQFHPEKSSSYGLKILENFGRL